MKHVKELLLIELKALLAKLRIRQANSSLESTDLLLQIETLEIKIKEIEEGE